MENLFEKLGNDCSEVFVSKEFNDGYYYDGKDLGAVYSKESTTFKVWSPVADKAVLCLYECGDGDCLKEKIEMEKGEKGTFQVEVKGDLDGVYYTYEFEFGHLKEQENLENDKTRFVYTDKESVVVTETQDVYSKAVGVNGRRSMVVNLERTNPEGWDNDKKPEFCNMTDAVIYEMHVRDFSIDESSGIKNKGKFLGVVEEGTKCLTGGPTGIDYMKELGITHVHLLPSYDYQSVDESKPENNEFNWGYDPQNYNVPEGSYSTNPYDGAVRIKEFKEMVMGLHKAGIRVIMDVVYNHTFSAYDSCFTLTVPNYYYRVRDNVNTNGSGCGNETASENIMFRKFLIESVLYWAKEYHVDGFRFDLMAVHDIDTMNMLSKAVKDYDSSIILYGEGWTGGPSKLPYEQASFKENALKVKDIAMFSDDIRDAVKGSVMDASDAGYFNGGLVSKKGDKLESLINSMKFGICASVKHPQVKERGQVNWERTPVFWAASPKECITYVSVHDNWTLWDKIAITCKDKSEEERIQINKAVAAVILTSQGIPLFQAGEEMLRSKPIDGGFEENSYNSPDIVNSIKWDRTEQYEEVVSYYKGLITFRKAHPALRMTEASDVAQYITFEDAGDERIIMYEIDCKNLGDICDKIKVIINGTDEDVRISLDGEWYVNIDENKAGTDVIETVTGEVTSKAMSVKVLTLK